MNAPPNNSSGRGSSTSRRPRAQSSALRPRRNTTASSSLVSHTQPPQPQLVDRNDHPHLAGSANCLCAACHLKPSIFPRSPEGRIVLPPPWSSPLAEPHPPPSIHSPTSATQGAVPSHVPNRVFSRERAPTSPVDTRLEGAMRRRIAPEGTVDRGEGTSRGTKRLSGPGVASIGLSQPYFPSPLGDTEASNQPERRSVHPDPGPLRTGRSDRSRASRLSKPYETRIELSEPPERPSTSHHPGPSANYPNPIPIHAPVATSEQHVSLYPASGREPWPNPYEHPGTEPFPQLFNLTQQLPQRIINISGSSTTLSSQPISHTASGESSYQRNPPPVDGTSITRPATTQPYHRVDRTLPPSRQQTPVPMASPRPPEAPQVIRFSSTSQNPLPSSSSAPDMPPSQEPGPSFVAWSHREGVPEATTSIQFQEPVMPEGHVAGPIRPRQLSIVKWDSERKRRQGYFAHEEGSEKSNFRHYNTQADFSR